MMQVFSTHGNFEPMLFGSLVISASEHLGQGCFSQGQLRSSFLSAKDGQCKTDKADRAASNMVEQ